MFNEFHNDLFFIPILETVPNETLVSLLLREPKFCDDSCKSMWCVCITSMSWKWSNVKSFLISKAVSQSQES